MKYPDCNWGCATGSTSGFFVFDPDNTDGWMWAMSQGLPATHCEDREKDPFAYHYYFKQLLQATGRDAHPGYSKEDPLWS
jgi:hypothetical protein